jgi:hypothetical protein
MTQYQIDVYYFSNYHIDPRNEARHGAGWTDWELVRRAEPRCPGHRQPKVPAWGYEDESDPSIFAKTIRAAAEKHALGGVPLECGMKCRFGFPSEASSAMPLRLRFRRQRWRFPFR